MFYRPLTAAERQKRYRERLKEENPEKYAESKKRNAERTNARRKKISETLPVEELRRKWREEKRKYKKNKTSQSLDNISKRQNYIRRLNYRTKRENIGLKNKLKFKNREIRKLKKKITQLKGRIFKLEEEVKSKNPTSTDACVAQNNVEVTPCSKTISFIEECLPNVSNEEKERVKKKILEHNVLVYSMKECYQNSDNSDTKITLKSLVDNPIVKKYKLKSKMATYLGLKGHIRHVQAKKRKCEELDRLYKFFERDDVSRATAGKKETRTYRKVKKQIRYLLETMNNLYKKYRSEGGIFKKTTFRKYKPFYVLSPKAQNRDTCACAKHENLQMKIKTLKSLGLLETDSLNDALALIVCDANSKNCSYMECDNCKNNIIEFDIKNKKLDLEVSWDEWILQEHKYKEKSTNNEDKTKVTKRSTKVKRTASLKVFLKLFNEELIKFKKHSYNIMHQYKAYRTCIKNLDVSSVVIHIDFSENYSCKLNTEIQSMHFGASRRQITLHTGLVYAKDQDPLPFCSLSNNNYHGPEGIWAHLTPVLELIKKKFPLVNTLHFYSDGPTTQYRQKKNFYLFSKYTKEHGFVHSTWNFFEASHGKGAADGIGGAIKRKLDEFVAHRVDITDADSAYQLLAKSDTKITIFYVPEDAIHKLFIDLIPLPGTMALHQVINTDLENTVLYRSLSCFCGNNSDKRGFCDCFDIKQATLFKSNTIAKPKSNKIENKAVTVLSDIRYTNENKAFFDLSNFSQFNLKKIDKNSICKVNKFQNQNVVPLKTADFTDNIIVSKQEKRQNENRKRSKRKVFEIVKPKKAKLLEHDTSTEDDENYSVKDSSDDDNYLMDEDEINYVEEQQDEENSFLERNVLNTDDKSTEDNNERNIELSSNLKKQFGMQIKEEYNRVKVQQDDVVISKLKNETNIQMKQAIEGEGQLEEFETVISIGETVLVRYYKKSWKYYVGIVEEVDTKKNLFTVNFFNTSGTKDAVRFTVPKRKDKDIVPSICIVKTIDLLQINEKPDVYVLMNEEDNTYF